MNVYSSVYTHVSSISFSKVFTSMMQMWAIRAQRKKLAQLDDDRLSDIGITFAQAQTEAARPMWDCPRHWK